MTEEKLREILKPLSEKYFPLKGKTQVKGETIDKPKGELDSDKRD